MSTPNNDRQLRDKEIRANWISSEGKFATDDFITQLLNSKAPKIMHDQLRMANFPTNEGEKYKSASRTVSQTTSKSKSSKTTISEEVIKEHFPKALPLPLITKGFIEWLEDEMLFSSRQTMHSFCCCAGDSPLKFAAAKDCFLGQQLPLGGICGLPLEHSAKVIGKRASLFGCKLLVTYQSHCSVSANGTFDFIEISDKGTDLRIETQCCQPGIECLNKILYSQKFQKPSSSMEVDPPRPTASVKITAPKPIAPPASIEEETLRNILLKHETKIRRTKNPPLIELPQIIYKEIRKSLLKTMVPALDVPTLFIGAIHIHTPPEIPDYYYIINVDLLRSKAVRNRSNKAIDSSSSGNQKEEDIPTPRSCYDTDKDDEDSDEGGEIQDEIETKINETKIDEEDLYEQELDCHLKEFYRCISKRIIAFEASKRGKEAVQQGIETASDRRLKRKLQKLEEKKYAEEKRNDDWNIKEGDDSKTAEIKITKWFIFFRWSRIVRRLVGVVKSSEIDDDWNLNGEEGEEKTKKKMGALFMTLRWNRLVKKVLRVHKRKERREELHYY